MNYTPGPWRVQNRPGRGYGKAFEVYTPLGRAFEGDQLNPAGVSIGQARANAALAAAAPDLLEALQTLPQSLAATDEDLSRWTEKARAAIAKATGQI